MPGELAGQLQLMIAFALTICPRAVDDDDGTIGGQAAVRQDTRNEPAAQGQMVLPAGEGDVSESQTEARRGFVDGYGCRVHELFRDVAGDADVAEAEDAGNEQQASDRPASAPQSPRHRAVFWVHH